MLPIKIVKHDWTFLNSNERCIFTIQSYFAKKWAEMGQKSVKTAKKVRNFENNMPKANFQFSVNYHILE